MLALQEETIKILTSIYGYKSSFWELWQQRKEEYFKAIQTEKHLLTTPMVSFEQYSSLADDKSAFGKIAIDSPLGTKQHFNRIDNLQMEYFAVFLLKKHFYLHFVQKKSAFFTRLIFSFLTPFLRLSFGLDSP